MGALLIERWLAGTEVLAIRDDASVAVLRDLVRTRGRALGLTAEACERTAAAASEVAVNQLEHAGGGDVGWRAVTRAGHVALELVAADRGRGIADPSAAFAGAARPAGSPGVGLSAAYRQVDELDVDVRWGEGTCVRLRTFAAGGRPPLSEIAILARAFPGEPASGDHAGVFRDEHGVTVAVVDGLGHGPLARAAADAAIEAIAGCAGPDLDAQLAAMNRALGGTRGAVAAVSRLDHAARELHHAGIGNVAARIAGIGGRCVALASAAGVLGVARRAPAVPPVRAAFGVGDHLVVATDGLATRFELDPALAAPTRCPIAIAHDLVTRYARPDDDVLVAVAR